MSQLARRFGGPEVRQFATDMEGHHREAAQDLKTLGLTYGIAMPSHLARQQREEVEQLARLGGAAFDSAYGDYMVQAHHRAVEMFEAQAVAGGNGRVSEFVERALPVLRTHLLAAKRLQAALVEQ